MFDIEKIILAVIKECGARVVIDEKSVTIIPTSFVSIDLVEPAEEPKPAPKKAPDPKKQGAKKALDIGKVKALRDAGWPLSEIASEMGVSPQTIANRLKGEE